MFISKFFTVRFVQNECDRIYANTVDNMIMCEVPLAVCSNPGGYKEMSSVLADQ
jgi:hypothetical protein